MIDTLHFLRPGWLILLAGVPFLGWWLLRRRGDEASWRRYLAPHLLPWLLASQGADGDRRLRVSLPVIAATLAIIAMAGPVFRQLPQPLYRAGQAVIIALDLSLSMAATDVPPTRLDRARQEISDLLDARTDGDTGLIVYGADAFVASPLTDDAATIKALLPALATDLLPRQGSNAARALARASALLDQAGVASGQVLLVSDDVDAGAQQQAAALRARGVIVSVLGVGTAAGAPVALDDGALLKDRDGSIVVPRLDAMALRAVAVDGGGIYLEPVLDDRDTRRLLAQFATGSGFKVSRTALNTDLWREEGPWLLLALLPIAALAFRRGVLACVIVALLPLPGRVEAATWSDLWLRPDQQGASAMAEGAPADAARLFADREWRAAAHYRAGEFEQSASLLDEIRTPRAQYNRGNALARAGDIPGAIDAYERALELDPSDADARFNLDALRKLEQQQQQGGEGEGDPQDGDAGDDSGASSGDNGGSQEGGGEQANEQGGESQQQPEQQDSKQSGNDAASEPQQADNGTDSRSESGAESGEATAGDVSGSAGSEGDADAAEEHFAEARQTGSEAENDGGEDRDNTGEFVAMRPSDSEETENERETRQATEQWLRRIPEDPGGLLRRKFYYQYQRQRDTRDAPEQPW